MEKNLVEPSDNFSDSGEEETYPVSSPDASSESDSDSDASEFIVKPSVTPAAAADQPEPQSGFESQTQHQLSYGEDSDEEDIKLSVIAAEAWDGPKKGNGGPGMPRSRPGPSDPATPAGSAGSKRAAAGLGAEAKRPKKKVGPEGSERKPGDLFRRIFSEDDEIALLEGMINYGSEKQSDPFADVSAFHEFVKPNLQSDPKVDQLLLKMRKLKTKYEKNKRKEESGSARNLKAHERKAYDLSKLVNWNEGRKGGKSVKSPKPAGKRMVAKKAPGEKANAGGKDATVNGDIPKVAEIVSWNNASMDRIGTRLFEGENRAVGEAEWHKLQAKEMELHRKLLEVLCAKSKLVSRALKTDNYSQ